MCLEVYGIVITSDCYHAIQNLPWRCCHAHTERESERERDSTRELQYLHCSNANISQSRSIDVYDKHGSTEGGRCMNVAPGAKRSQGQNKKSDVDHLDQYWLNFAFSGSPPPVCLYLIVSSDICYSCRERRRAFCMCHCLTEEKHSFFFKLLSQRNQGERLYL